MKQIDEAVKRLNEVEAIASLLEQRAAELRIYCHRTKAKLEGVSTSSRRKADMDLQRRIAATVARRNARIKTIAASGN